VEHQAEPHSGGVFRSRNPLGGRGRLGTAIQTFMYCINEINKIITKILKTSVRVAVLRIRDVIPGSRIRIFPSRIPGQKDSGSWIRIRIKEFKYFQPNVFLSSQNYDPDLDFYPSRIPGPGVKKEPDPESGTMMGGLFDSGVCCQMEL
jgi:hypothetical protein